MPRDKNKTGLESTETIRLRNQTVSLSASDVDDMLRKHDFYDNKRNPEGKGFLHQYREQKKKSDKVIIDNVTGLMWQQSCSKNLKNISSAKVKDYINLCNKSNHGFGGYYDWRLPTLEEAMSLMEPNRKGILLKDNYINNSFDRKKSVIWTSDCETSYQKSAWFVSYKKGNCFTIPLGLEKIKNWVRLVRDNY